MQKKQRNHLVALIAAIGLEDIYHRAPRYVIGSAGGTKLPWHLPRDMEFFRKKTMSHVVVMGRKTWESIAPKYRPLPGRINIVLTKDQNFHAEGTIVCSSVEEVLRYADRRKVFIIGGQEIYELFLPVASTVFLTYIHGRFHGDRFFPKLDPEGWVKCGHGEHYSSDAKNKYGMTFETYVPAGDMF